MTGIAALQNATVAEWHADKVALLLRSVQGDIERRNSVLLGVRIEHRLIQSRGCGLQVDVVRQGLMDESRETRIPKLRPPIRTDHVGAATSGGPLRRHANRLAGLFRQWHTASGHDECEQYGAEVLHHDFALRPALRKDTKRWTMPSVSSGLHSPPEISRSRSESAIVCAIAPTKK